MVFSRTVWVGCVGVFASCVTVGTASAGLIVDDDVEDNGDMLADTGTITTSWAGWEGTGTPGANYFGGLLDPAKDDDTGVGGPADQLPLEALNGLVPVFNHGTEVTVTYGGAVAAGTYTLQMQVLNWSNFGFAAPVVDFAGLTASDSTTTTPGLGDDEIWSFTYVVGEGDANIGNALSLSILAGGNPTDNAAVDHVRIDFEPVPEPGSLALIGLGGLALLRRRRA